MKRRALSLLFVFLALFASGIPAAFGQACSTPPPTYTPTPGYRATVQAAAPGNLLLYLPLSETSGTTAEDDSGNNADGTYSGVTVNGATFLTGDPAISSDGVNDNTSITSSFFTSNFNGQEGTAIIWAQVANAGVWSDTLAHAFFRFAANTATDSIFPRLSGSNTLIALYIAGSVTKSLTVTSGTHGATTSWFMFGITWSKAADQYRVFWNGVQFGATQTGLGTFAGTLSSTFTALGSVNTSTGGSSWHGNLSNFAVWDTPLDPTQVAILATIDPTTVPPPTATLCPTYTWTPSPTWTPTPTPTPTNTPNIRTYLTVVPPGSSAPGQDVLILHQVTIGQALIASLLFVIVVIYVLSFTRKLRRG